MAVSKFSYDGIFSDAVNFPYGLARSGDFTRSQAMLLENHGNVYRSLFDGVRQPTTDAEEHFVEFCKHGCCEPENEHEKAWSIYLKRLELKKVYLKSLRCSKTELVEEDTDNSIAIDETADEIDIEAKD